MNNIPLAVILLMVLSGCSVRTDFKSSTIEPSRTNQVFNFSHQLVTPEKTGLISAFSTKQKLYLQFIPKTYPGETIKTYGHDGSEQELKPYGNQSDGAIFETKKEFPLTIRRASFTSIVKESEE